MTELAMTDKPIQIRFPDLIREPQPALRVADEAMLALAADTFGWDTAFAIRVTDVNSTFAKPGVSPSTWSQVNDPEYRGAGDFSAWRVALGGSGSNLHMDIPIPTGSMHYQGNDYSMDGSVATIEVKLEFVPQPTPAASPNGKVVDLRIAADVVSVLDLQLGVPQPTSIKFLMMGLLSDWFNANLDTFTHVFCSVNLNMKADEDQFQWLKPTTVGYAYVDGADEQNAFFGVLAMTENRSAQGLPYQISPEVIPEGARAGLLISPERYLEKVLLPAIPELFLDAGAVDFEVNEAAVELRNARPLLMKETVANGRKYTPDVPTAHFSVRVKGDELVLDMRKVHAEFSPGIDMYMDYTSYSRLELVQRSDGTHAIHFVEARPSDTTHVVEVASWVRWTEVVAGIVAGVITAFVGVKGDAVFKTVTRKIIAAVICALVLGTLAAMGEILAAVAADDVEKLPGVDLLALNVTNPVIWPGASEFTLTSAGLNAALRLGGDPNFAT